MVLEYLKNLLESHDCVILPGFGGFIGQYHSASVHPIKHTFVPPSKKIAFNQSLINQDGLLLSTIQLKEKVSAEEAIKHIQSFIDQIKKDLSEKGLCLLEGLGQFSYNAERNLVFKGDGNQNFLDSSYGLPHLFIKPLENIVMEETNAKREINSGQGKEKSNSKKIFLVFPIVLITLGILSSLLLLNNQDDAIQAASIIKEDTITEDMSSYDIQEEIPVIEEEDMASFHVIIGVYSNRDNAALISSQQPGSEILEIDGLYKISLAQFSSLDEATDSLDVFRNEFGNDLWVLKHN